MLLEGVLRVKEDGGSCSQSREGLGTFAWGS